MSGVLVLIATLARPHRASIWSAVRMLPGGSFEWSFAMTSLAAAGMRWS
jgi:hypothetical protein